LLALFRSLPTSKLDLLSRARPGRTGADLDGTAVALGPRRGSRCGSPGTRSRACAPHVLLVDVLGPVGFFDASPTSEPNLLALASDVEARVAMAAKDWKRAERHIESALAIVAKFDIPTTGWRVHATRFDLARSVKDDTAAEHHRARAEAVVLALAESFDRDEPLRHAFLSSPRIRLICRKRPGSRRVGAR
jgi:hypothetical protein